MFDLISLGFEQLVGQKQDIWNMFFHHLMLFFIDFMIDNQQRNELVVADLHTNCWFQPLKREDLLFLCHCKLDFLGFRLLYD